MSTIHKKAVEKKAILILVWYHVFGMLHEMVHVFTAWSFGMEMDVSLLFEIAVKALIGRACDMGALSSSTEVSVGTMDTVRHAGWIGSLVMALMVSRCHRRSSSLRAAAWITFFEAFSTDFLNIGTIASKPHLLFCGNFGLVFVNSAWFNEDYGQTALDMLEQMVHITMIRGAQSGGVLSWAIKQNEEGVKEARGIRSRVVNGKRSDLSKGLRKKVLSDSFRFGKVLPGIQTFLGHTRFATSSKATFDGTHPHQWTPSRKYRVYHLYQPSVLSASKPVPTTGVPVENFITHNGDFDSFSLNGVQYGLTTVQKWLILATNAPAPSPVDSVAIAGMIDLLRTEGCFGLSARYALFFNCASSTMDTNVQTFPSYDAFEKLGIVFEDALTSTCLEFSTTIGQIRSSRPLRQKFASIAVTLTRSFFDTKSKAALTLSQLVALDNEALGGGSLQELVSGTIDAFFDNDLFQAARLFMLSAKGSFGLMLTSSLDAHRQICLAARGQPMSVAFYPKEGMISYGSELAAVKVGLTLETPERVRASGPKRMTIGDADDSEDEYLVEQISRLDLDDLGGEIVLLDWGCGTSGNDVEALVHQESKTSHSCISSRIVLLENNEFVRALTMDSRDPVLEDIRDIPRVCKHIQDNWKEADLNRYTALNLVNKIKQRLVSRMAGKVPTHCNSIDILLTGCETSLWLAEQFASDLTKAFPRLSVRAVSSNKLLGVFGQDLSMPAIGYPMSENITDLKGAVVIIVSHSGQTFAPLACSSLLQSFTDDIFLVSSEWDTQIGRQLRGIWQRQKNFHPSAQNFKESIFSSRIFTTDVGVRSAEPCSVSVAAIHQLLTQILMHVSTALLGDSDLRSFCGAFITESDLTILERCNQDSITALECIVGSYANGARAVPGTQTESDLREAGDIWSEHVLEIPKASIITFIYVVGTVFAGYPLVSGVATAIGLLDGWGLYVCRFFDGLLYYFFHQLTVLALRLLQGRNLRHRTTGRTVVIGDCPWVAQSIDAFLSKLFACSYPMAGINVLSGNPSDHLAHRHTHRIVRGTLLVCGRPDGRLSALTNAELSVCLSVNQASSIQNIGGTCESITIGHSPSPLTGTAKDIFLANHRPLFLCERVVDELDEKQDASTHSDADSLLPEVALDRASSSDGSVHQRLAPPRIPSRKASKPLVRDDSTRFRGTRRRSAREIKGLYTTLKQLTEAEVNMDDSLPMSTFDNSMEQKVVKEMLSERLGLQLTRRLFDKLDTENCGSITVDMFIQTYLEAHGRLSENAVLQVLKEMGVGQSDGLLSFDDFARISAMPEVEVIRKLQISTPRDDRGMLAVRPSTEEYFGEELQRVSGAGAFGLSKTQHFAMELYESRIASLERFVAMCVMFHQMGSRVQLFFEKVSFGAFSYRMDRTHSIMRIATTASPVSGADVRERIEALQVRARIQNALRVIESAWCKYQQAEVKRWKLENKPSLSGATTSQPSYSTPESAMINDVAGDALRRRSSRRSISTMSLSTRMQNRRASRLVEPERSRFATPHLTDMDSMRSQSVTPLSIASLLLNDVTTPAHFRKSL